MMFEVTSSSADWKNALKRVLLRCWATNAGAPYRES